MDAIIGYRSYPAVCGNSGYARRRSLLCLLLVDSCPAIHGRVNTLHFDSPFAGCRRGKSTILIRKAELSALSTKSTHMHMQNRASKRPPARKSTAQFHWSRHYGHAMSAHIFDARPRHDTLVYFLYRAILKGTTDTAGWGSL